MAKPYSMDLRERMVRAVKGGRSRHEVARIFGVSPSCVIKLMQRYRETGAVAPAKFGGYKKPILTAHEDKVRKLVAASGYDGFGVGERAGRAGNPSRSLVGPTLPETPGAYVQNVWPAPFARGLC